jgi:hypothetical protein
VGLATRLCADTLWLLPEPGVAVAVCRLPTVVRALQVFGGFKVILLSPQISFSASHRKAELHSSLTPDYTVANAICWRHIREAHPVEARPLNLMPRNVQPNRRSTSAAGLSMPTALDSHTA